MGSSKERETKQVQKDQESKDRPHRTKTLSVTQSLDLWSTHTDAIVDGREVETFGLERS